MVTESRRTHRLSFVIGFYDVPSMSGHRFGQ